MDCFVLLRNSLFLDKLIILMSFFHYQYWEITMVLSMGKAGEGSDLSLWWTTDGRTCRMGEGGTKLLCYWMSRWELQRWFYIFIDCYQSSSQVAWLCSWNSVLCRNLGLLLSRLPGWVSSICAIFWKVISNCTWVYSGDLFVLEIWGLFHLRNLLCLYLCLSFWGTESVEANHLGKMKLNKILLSKATSFLTNQIK